MTDIAIKVENLSKLYRIGSRQNDYRTLRDTITDAFTAPFRKLRKRVESKRLEGDSNLSALGSPQNSSLSALSSPLSADMIWALKDVSFEVKRGEVVGIIGRNGAGKSTLLKILSRITEPSEGYAEIRGRVGSLLEVGTGFHAELSGRENIYLSGAILGMRKAEIERKFDEIVAFAEIEKFIDTPVKHYSSGMYVRLAFAVAAHLDPEILLIDEVLAVGDQVFRKKCIEKMQEISTLGRTVFIVSHDLPMVSTLCKRCVLFDQGELLQDGSCSEVVDLYIRKGMENGKSPQGLTAHPGRSKQLCNLLTEVRLLNEKGDETLCFPMGGAITVQIAFQSKEALSFPVMGFRVVNLLGHTVFSAVSLWDSKMVSPSKARSGTFHCVIPSPSLNQGQYSITLVLVQLGEIMDKIENAIQFEIIPADVFSTGIIPRPDHGSIYAICEWSFEDGQIIKKTPHLETRISCLP